LIENEAKGFKQTRENIEAAYINHLLPSMVFRTVLHFLPEYYWHLKNSSFPVSAISMGTASKRKLMKW
jgi:hypothetical protein